MDVAISDRFVVCFTEGSCVWEYKYALSCSLYFMLCVHVCACVCVCVFICVYLSVCVSVCNICVFVDCNYVSLPVQFLLQSQQCLPKEDELTKHTKIS